MAHLLRFDGANDYVTFPQVLSGSSSFDVEIDFVPRSISSSVYQAVYTNGQVSIANNRHAMYLWGGSRAEIAFIIGGTRRILNSPVGTFTAGVRYKVNAVYDGSTLQMRVNGISVASIAATGTVGGSSGLTTLGRPADTEGRCPMDFYGFKVTAGGVLSRFYDPSNTSSGTVLPDSTSAQDGTLTSFTVPDCWVFYNSITTTGIPNNTLGAALNQACAINLNNYFTGATSYSVLSGSLPTGLSIVGNQIVGTPTTAESTTLVIRASNSIDVLDSATITFNISGGQAASPTQIKFFDGTDFSNKTIKRWNGSAFVDVTLKRWNGSAFVDL